MCEVLSHRKKKLKKKKRKYEGVKSKERGSDVGDERGGSANQTTES